MLSEDNIMRFISIETYKILFVIGSHEEGISTAAISPNGRYIASVMENGSLNLYSVQALTQEVNKVRCFIFLIIAVDPIKGDTCPHNFCISSSLLPCHWLRSVGVPYLTLQKQKKWFAEFLHFYSSLSSSVAFLKCITLVLVLGGRKDGISFCSN